MPFLPLVFMEPLYPDSGTGSLLLSIDALLLSADHTFLLFLPLLRAVAVLLLAGCFLYYRIQSWVYNHSLLQLLFDYR